MTRDGSPPPDGREPMHLRTLLPAALLGQAYAAARIASSDSKRIAVDLTKDCERLLCLEATAPLNPASATEEFAEELIRLHNRMKVILAREAALASKLGEARQRIGIVLSLLTEKNK